MATTKRDKKAPKPPSIEGIEKQTPITIQAMRKILEDVFISPTTVWSTCSVRSAITSHDTGVFSNSGRLVDAMMRDPRIFACCNTLIYGVLGLPFEWKWPEKYIPTKEDEKYLIVLNKWWRQFLETAVPATLIKWLANMGVVAISKSWELQYLQNDEVGEYGKFYVPEVHVMHPSNMYFNTATFTYNLITMSHGMIEIQKNDPRIQIVEHVDSERAFMQGAVRSLGLVWLDKWMALSDWRSYLSIFGNPLRMLTTNKEYSTPTGAGEFDIETFIQNMGAALAYGAPIHLMEGQKMDLLQADAAGANLFKDKIEDCNKEIAIVYLGQNLTTDVSSGSLASAKVHDNVRQDYVEAYTTTLNRALGVIVKEFYKFNFPDSLTVPEPYFDPEPPVNELELGKVHAEKAKSLLDLSKSLETLQGIQVNGKSALESIDIKELIKQYL